MTTKAIQLRISPKGGKKSLDISTKQAEISDNLILEIKNTAKPTHIHIQPKHPVDEFVKTKNNDVLVEDDTVIALNISHVEEAVSGEIDIIADYGDSKETISVTIEPSDIVKGKTDSKPRQPIEGEKPRFSPIEKVIGSLIGVATILIFLFALLFAQFTVAFILLLSIGLAFVLFYLARSRSEGPGSEE